MIEQNPVNDDEIYWPSDDDNETVVLRDDEIEDMILKTSQFWFTHKILRTDTVY